jgi:hypothetical protein
MRFEWPSECAYDQAGRDEYDEDFDDPFYRPVVDQFSFAANETYRHQYKEDADLLCHCYQTFRHKGINYTKRAEGDGSLLTRVWLFIIICKKDLIWSSYD